MTLRSLILLINLLLLCSQLYEVAAFKPLIKLPRSRRRDRANISISVDDFGAKGDGRHDDTKAFIDAWRFACSWRAGAILEVPAGNVYFVRPINFTSHCRSKITLLVRGTIIAPSDPHVWNGLNSRRWLYFDRVNNLEVKGGGTINGMGQKWWAQSCKRNATNPCRHAPTAITFHRSKHLIVQDLTLLNSQQMHMVIGNCFQVKVSRLKLLAPARSPSTDGIHITASTSVLVEDSLIRTGDDCISIVTNSSDITIKNLICGPGHGISIGSLGKSGAWDQVHKVLVDGALITDTENGVRIKTWQGGSGYARNIVFSNILMKNVSNPIIIDQYYCDSFTPCGNQTSAVKVDGISYRGIKGTSATEEVMKFDCSDIFPCENIFVEDILLLLESGGEPTAYCWKASGFGSGDDCITIVTNSSDITIKNLICGPGHGISIGSLGKSGAWDQVHKVLVDGALITDTENGVRIKTWQGGSGYARNIVFSNILMKNVLNPIIIDQYYRDSLTHSHHLETSEGGRDFL